MLSDDEKLRIRDEFAASLYEPVSKQDRYKSMIPSLDENELIFLCCESGFILNIDHNVEKYLQLQSPQIKGQFIGFIMSEFLCMLHMTYIFPNFKTASKTHRAACSSFIKAMTAKRPLIVYTSMGNPVYVEISVNTQYTADSIPLQSMLTEQDLEYYFVVHLTISDNQLDAFHLYDTSIKHLRQDLTDFRETRAMVVICIDFMNSTETLLSKGPFHMASINKQFYDSATSIIAKYFYPYINFHEIIGDCFVFVVNADWGCTIDNFCASLAINFVGKLQYSTNNIVSIRAGVAYGPLVIGFIGETSLSLALALSP